MVQSPRSRRRWLWLGPLVLLALVVVLTMAAVITLRVAFSGSALAERVCARLNGDMRGRIEIRSIDWPLASIPTVMTGGWVPVFLRDVQVRDANGVVVLRSPEIRAEIDVHAVLFGHHDVLARRVVMNGGEIVVREIANDEISLIEAFASPRPRDPATVAPTSARFELRDAEVRRLRVVVDVVPIDAAATRHELHAAVADVSARGSLAYDPRVSPPRLVFQTAPRGGAGEIVMRTRRIAVASVDVKELAQADTTVAFAGDLVLDGGEQVHVDGALRDYWPTGHFGRDSRITVNVTGLRTRVAVEPPVELEVAPLVITHDLQTGEGQLAEVVARGANAAVRVSARWGGGADGELPAWMTGEIATDGAIDLAPWLRRDLQREFGHTLRGKVNISVDARTDGLVHVGEPDLRLERLRVDAGTLVVEHAKRLRIIGLHYRVPGLEGTYDCTLERAQQRPGPPVRRSCDGASSGDVRVLMRLRKLDTW